MMITTQHNIMMRIGQYLERENESSDSEPLINNELMNITEEVELNISAGTAMKKRGTVYCRKLTLLPPGGKLNVEFDEDGVAIGDNASLFSFFLGQQVHNKSVCPIQVKGWNKYTSEILYHLWACIQRKKNGGKCSRVDLLLASRTRKSEKAVNAVTLENNTRAVVNLSEEVNEVKKKANQAIEEAKKDDENARIEAEQAKIEAEKAKKEAEVVRNDVDKKIAENNEVWEKKFSQLLDFFEARGSLNNDDLGSEGASKVNHIGSVMAGGLAKEQNSELNPELNSELNPFILLVCPAPLLLAVLLPCSPAACCPAPLPKLNA
uniref:Uncharacterized protein n=1 Tax=Chenopodium quinoa TaxID=63459 RepID=A0A803MM47_CHEQI